MSEKAVTEKLKIVGMHCASCAGTIERKLRSLRGVMEAAVSFAAEEALVKYNPKEVVLKDIVRAVRDVGYDVYKEEAYLTVRNLASVNEEAVIEGRLRSLPGVIDVGASHASKSVAVVLNPLTIDV